MKSWCFLALTLISFSAYAEHVDMGCFDRCTNGGGSREVCVQVCTVANHLKLSQEQQLQAQSNCKSDLLFTPNSQQNELSIKKNS